MRQGAFFNISFEQQLIKSPNLISKGNNFQESFKQFGGLRLGSRPFQFSNLPQLLNNQLYHDSNVSFF